MRGHLLPGCGGTLARRGQCGACSGRAGCAENTRRGREGAAQARDPHWFCDGGTAAGCCTSAAGEAHGGRAHRPRQTCASEAGWPRAGRVCEGGRGDGQGHGQGQRREKADACKLCAIRCLPRRPSSSRQVWRGLRRGSPIDACRTPWCPRCGCCGAGGAELPTRPCLPGIHDLQHTWSQPLRTASGEPVPAGTWGLVHAQRAAAAGGRGAQGQTGRERVREKAFLQGRGHTRVRERSGQEA